MESKYLEEMKILIIGGGNMGFTYAKAFINSHVVSPEELMILEKENNKNLNIPELEKMAKIYSNPSIVKDADLIILAVKPQDASTLFNEITPFITDNQIFLSIMAGITIQTMVDSLKVNKVIRAMPNLPSQIGVGMTAFTSTKDVSRFEEQMVQNLLQTTGKAISVPNEQLINAVTAISGSGPAYIYYFMDAMIAGAVQMGIESTVAELLVKQTFSGALDLIKQNSYNCKEWINKVSSKGGTTEAAINYFEKNKLNEIIINGSKKAFYRAEELGK